MDETQINLLLNEPSALRDHIRHSIQSTHWHRRISALERDELKQASVVLFVISNCASGSSNGFVEPCLVLNKRSSQVRQAGDLCCPGGGLNWMTDNLFAKFLRFPGAPLGSRHIWRFIQKDNSIRQKNLRANLSILLTAGLREAWEEMRLNPLRFTFLGVLPEQPLVMFRRVIHPVVGWASPQSYTPNWEVERVVSITLRNLLNPSRYGRFLPVAASGHKTDGHSLQHNSFPCYIHDGQRGRELLWGATYRIALKFLELVFDFNPPAGNSLPVIERQLDEAYMNGSR